MARLRQWPWEMDDKCLQGDKEWRQKHLDPFNGNPDTSPAHWKLFEGVLPPSKGDLLLFYSERDYWPQSVILSEAQVQQVLRRFGYRDSPHRLSKDQIRRFVRNFDAEGFAVDPSTTAGLDWDALPVKHRDFLEDFQAQQEVARAKGSGIKDEDASANAPVDMTAPVDTQNPANGNVTSKEQPVALLQGNPASSGPSTIRKRLAETTDLREEAKKLRANNQQRDSTINGRDEEIVKLNANIQKLQRKNTSLLENMERVKGGAAKSRVLAKLLYSFQSLYIEVTEEGDEQDEFLEGVKNELGTEEFDRLVSCGRDLMRN